jgi:hypothetical protein
VREAYRHVSYCTCRIDAEPYAQCDVQAADSEEQRYMRRVVTKRSAAVAMMVGGTSSGNCYLTGYDSRQQARHVSRVPSVTGVGSGCWAGCNLSYGDCPCLVEWRRYRWTQVITGV